MSENNSGIPDIPNVLMNEKVMKIFLEKIIIVSITILLIACSKNNVPDLLGDEIQVPDSDFRIRTLEGYRVSIISDGIYVQPPLPNISPTFLIWSQSFNIYEPREVWLERRFTDPELSELEELTINGISGFIAHYKAENVDIELVGAWVAAIATEDEGLVIYAHSSPDEVQEIRYLLFAMLESVSITYDE